MRLLLVLSVLLASVSGTSINRPINRWIDRKVPVMPSINQPILETINQLIDQSINQPIISNISVLTGDENIFSVSTDDVILIQGLNFYQSINQPNDQSTDQSIGREIEQSINHMLSDVFPGMIDRSTDQSTDLPEVRLISLTGVEYNCSELYRWDSIDRLVDGRLIDRLKDRLIDDQTDGLLCRIPSMDSRFSNLWFSIQVTVTDQSIGPLPIQSILESIRPKMTDQPINQPINQQTATLEKAFIYVVTPDWRPLGVDASMMLIIASIATVLALACCCTWCALKRQSTQIRRLHYRSINRSTSRSAEDLSRALLHPAVAPSDYPGHQSTNQSTYQPSDAPSYYMVEPSYSQPPVQYYQPINQPINQPMAQPVNHFPVYYRPAQVQTVAPSALINQPTTVYYVAEPSAPAMM